MIAKWEFYHGVALVRLLKDKRFQTVRKDRLGYIVNDRVFVFVKYTTKARTPWMFTFGQKEVEQLNSLATTFRDIIVVLVCAGDGICAVSWCDASRLLGNKGGWISTRRKFNEQYAVAGQAGQLSGKDSLSEWPSIVFERVSHERASTESNDHS
jgi:hypothetical protein